MVVVIFCAALADVGSDGCIDRHEFSIDGCIDRHEFSIDIYLLV